MAPHRWPADLKFTSVVLEPEPERCVTCSRLLTICAHRDRYLHSLEGPLHLICKLCHCPDDTCPGHHQTHSPAAELLIAPPYWTLAWDGFAWLGHRRIAQDWRVDQIREELHERFKIITSRASIERYGTRYQTMVAAREQDLTRLTTQYKDYAGLILSIDGLQPEKGHETLYAVREVQSKRIWFCEPLLSSATDEVKRVLKRARDWAARIDKPVLAWISDKQDAFVTGIRDLFPGVPHRYCRNHFLRDVAKPVLELDSHAKVQMRRKVRGLREIERQIIDASATVQPGPPDASRPPPAGPTKAPLDAPSAPAPTAQQQAVLDYCSAVRGILNDSQGGPLYPPALRMADALTEVRASLQRALDESTPTPAHRLLSRLAGCIDRGLNLVRPQLDTVRGYVEIIKRIDACLNSDAIPITKRQSQFSRLGSLLRSHADAVHQHMGALMKSFKPGLFVGGDKLPGDNLDLERSFKLPKRHQRHIHGRAHAGAKLVQEGPTLLPALDAHQRHPGRFSAQDLLPYHKARPPACQQASCQRRRIMRRARSRKKRPALLAELERRLRDGS